MDLSSFELTQEAVFVQLLHPVTNKPLADPNGPVGVRVYGADSDEFKKHRRRLANKGLEKSFKRERATIEEVEAETDKTLAGCIAELVNISWKGQELKAPGDVSAFLLNMPWAGEQIDKAMADRSRFMPALPKD